MTIEYVAGFLFSHDLTNVALIKKNRPDWQAGKLNAIGGHIEETDVSPLYAMRREFEEETGVNIVYWNNFAKIQQMDKFAVHFFASTGELKYLETMTDEEVKVIHVDNLKYHDTIENIPWLMHLAIDCLTDNRPLFAEITYPANSR